MDINATKIQQEMDRLGWSQSELARRLGKHRQWVWAVLNSKKGKTFRSVEAIASVLNMDPKDLIK